MGNKHSNKDKKEKDSKSDNKPYNNYNTDIAVFQ